MDVCKLKKPPLNINGDNPFEEDLLNRKESIEVLTELVGKTNDSFVLTIDSCWGSGKTTFIKMWQKHLESQGFQTLFFNAWENDCCENALVALLGEMDIAIQNKNEGTDDLNKRMGELKSVASGVLLNAGKMGLKVLTNGVVDCDEIVKIEKDEIVKKIENYQELKDSMGTFRDALENLAKEMSNGKPVIFFIDELDRCRPDYAIQVLEKAKHFFNVDNMIFVLAIDQEQLGHSIRSIYGSGMDVDGYLRRFIDLKFHLPNPERDKFIKSLFDSLDLKFFFEERNKLYPRGEMRDDEKHFLENLSMLLNLFNFSLRTIEQCCSEISLVFKMTPYNQNLHPVILSFLIAVKNYDAEIYRQYGSGGIGVEEIMKRFFSSPESKDLLDTSPGILLEAELIYYDRTSRREVVMAVYSDRVTGRESFINGRLKFLSERIFYPGNTLRDLMRKVDMLENFVR